MGSLRIHNVPTIGDLGLRLARRKFRNAITGRTIVQAYNKLKDLAGRDEINGLLTDLDEVYSYEVGHLGLQQEQISQCLLIVHKKVKDGEHPRRPNEIIKHFGVDDFQQFEFDLVEKTPNLKSIRIFLEGLDIEQMDISNVPLLRCLSALDFEIAKSRLRLSKGEGEKLREYVDRCEGIIRENSCPVTRRNRIVLSNDIKEIKELLEWAPIEVTINGLDDPQEVQEELESAYECICEDGSDFLRIESNPMDDEISIGYYSCIFVK